jgi:beta-lactamase superfamily II metal-dependent hydrolase
MADETMFAGYPAPFIHAEPGGAKTQQLIWGDFVRVTGQAVDDWVSVKSRRTPGWMRRADLQAERLLEVAFVDIGQGDGTFVVLPDDRFLLVDAGQGDHMLRFLSWRFNLRADRARVIRFGHGVISHPDQDHYKGFAPLFASGQVRFDTLFHSGIVERAGDAPLGPRQTVDGVSCLVDVIHDDAALKARLADPAFVGRKVYPSMLAAALEHGAVDRFAGLNAHMRHLPGFAPGERADGLVVEVLGPWPDGAPGEAPRLRWLGDPGKTKNGHSVVLRLVWRDVKLLLGGDLNIPAEQHLLQRHTGLALPAGANDEAPFLARARAVFGCDIAKACHHGSADFTTLFLRALNPAATVVSSGDDEPHAHPRPDALGAFGRHGRGERPLIFSTELARSARENIRDPQALKAQLQALLARRAELDDTERIAALDAQIDAALAVLERSIAVYGMINLRTDGHRVLMAQKLERKRGNGEEWDWHRLEPGDDGVLRYVAKHAD